MEYIDKYKVGIKMLVGYLSSSCVISDHEIADTFATEFYDIARTVIAAAVQCKEQRVFRERQRAAIGQ